MMAEIKKENYNNANETVFNREERGKRTYTVDEIQKILDISRTSAYNLVKKNLFRSVRVGGHIRISKKSFDEWLDTQLC